MDKKWTFLSGMGLGAAVMFLLEPSAHRRRAVVRDKATSAARRVARFSGKASRDLANRARGLSMEAYGRMREDNPTGETLAARVRARLGRAVSDPGALTVLVNDGRVTLRGPVLANELDDLIDAVSRVRGVRSVVNELDGHREAGNAPALQSGRRWRGLSGWSPGARLLSGLVAGTAAVFAVAKRVA